MPDEAPVIRTTLSTRSMGGLLSCPSVWRPKTMLNRDAPRHPSEGGPARDEPWAERPMRGGHLGAHGGWGRGSAEGEHPPPCAADREAAMTDNARVIWFDGLGRRDVAV